MKSEAYNQQQIRLKASYAGSRLWRNNVGAVTTHDGRHVRFGLANDSATANKTIKSSDLIGITPILIQPYHIGVKMGIFTAVEVKREGWTYSGTPRELAQHNFHLIVNSLGGIGKFSTGEL